MKTSWENVQVDKSPMRLYACYPDGPGPFPAMVVIPNKEGVAEFTQEMTRRLAEAGYFSVAPDLYHRSPPEIKDDVEAQQARRRDDQVITDVNAAVDFLRGREFADVGKLGIIGFCMGARVAYPMAAANPGFRAAVDFHGGGIFKAWGDGPSPFVRSAEIRCPLQGHFGEDDKNPSLADMHKLDAEMTRLDKRHEFYSYPGAGHAFNRKGWEGYREDADRVS
jgi:carboxymethylenebutenolidase